MAATRCIPLCQREAYWTLNDLCIRYLVLAKGDLRKWLVSLRRRSVNEICPSHSFDLFYFSILFSQRPKQLWITTLWRHKWHTSTSCHLQSDFQIFPDLLRLPPFHPIPYSCKLVFSMAAPTLWNRPQNSPFLPGFFLLMFSLGPLLQPCKQPWVPWKVINKWKLSIFIIKVQKVKSFSCRRRNVSGIIALKSKYAAYLEVSRGFWIINLSSLLHRRPQ